MLFKRKRESTFAYLNCNCKLEYFGYKLLLMEDAQGVLTKQERRQAAKEQKQKERNRLQSTSKLKKIILIAVALATIGFLGYKLISYISTPTTAGNEALAVTDADWVRGNKEAKVTLVEYADFECPACAAYEPLVERLIQDFPEQLRVVSRHYPLINIHKNAMPASQAAEAAGKQGKFWEMGKVLYERQEEWVELSNSEDKFSEYARELGLNEEQFLSDYDSQPVKDKINADILTSQRLRLSYTPSFLLDGRLISPKNYDEFKKLVEDEIQGYSLK